MKNSEYGNSVYAGVLGKIIGVYLGRPVEGWPYKRIKEKIGIVNSYVHTTVGVPLVVADDDITGTFTFFNAIEDYTRDISKIRAYDFGETWLDYVIENKSVFWWGGLGRSTEHTAFLRLKSGIKAPQSGSISLNGKAVAEQIGAQIFIDAFSMMCPGDPEMARNIIKKAASVSHDGISVESACLIGGMQAQAFIEKDIDKIICDVISLKGTSDELKKIVNEVKNVCEKKKNWREVRKWLDIKYGYDLYPGNCHVIPNLTLVLASIFLGGDDFSKSLEIAVSSGWDTDSNAGVIGCFNGIRLGIDNINKSYNYREPIADRMYIVSSNGGECVSDAVIQTRRIINAKKKLYGEKIDLKISKRFNFEYKGSRQGFETCPYLGNSKDFLINTNTINEESGLLIKCDFKNIKRSVAFSTPVMWLPSESHSNYNLIGSPTLYSGQTVELELINIVGKPTIRLYIAHYDFDDNIIIKYSGMIKLTNDRNIKWEIPDTEGMPIARIGIECFADKKHKENSLIMKSMNWKGAPKSFSIKGSLRNYDIKNFNMAMNSFTTSAKQFSFDSRATFVISNIEDNGVATIGTKEWDDYIVTSKLSASIHKRFGLIVRAKGHRHYYAAVMFGGSKVAIIKKEGSQEKIINQLEYNYEENKLYKIAFKCYKERLSMYIDDKLLIECSDRSFLSGASGFLVDCGTILAYDFSVESCKDIN